MNGLRDCAIYTYIYAPTVGVCPRLQGWESEERPVDVGVHLLAEPVLWNCNSPSVFRDSIALLPTYSSSLEGGSTEAIAGQG